MRSDNNRMLKRQANGPEKIQERPSLSPAVDIYENADELMVLADLPGVSPEGLTIHLEKGLLTIEAHRSEEATGRPLSGDVRLFDYRRTFLVPQGIDADKIAADMKQGVVRVHLPKAAALKPRQIRISAGS